MGEEDVPPSPLGGGRGVGAGLDMPASRRKGWAALGARLNPTSRERAGLLVGCQLGAASEENT